MTVINLIPEVYLIITIVLFIILILINHLIFKNKYSILFICMFSCFLSFFIKSMFFPISIFFGSMKDEMWNTFTHSMFYLNPLTEVNKILSMNSSLIIKHLLIMIPFGLLINELVHFKEKNKIKQIGLGCLISIFIEVIELIINYATYFRQYVISLSDIIIHTSGVIIGIMIWNIIRRCKIYQEIKTIIYNNKGNES